MASARWEILPEERHEWTDRELAFFKAGRSFARIEVEGLEAEVERMRAGWDADVDWANELLVERDRLRTAIDDALSALGTGNCAIENCEGCWAGMDSAREVLQGATSS